MGVKFNLPPLVDIPDPKELCGIWRGLPDITILENSDLGAEAAYMRSRPHRFSSVFSSDACIQHLIASSSKDYMFGALCGDGAVLAVPVSHHSGIFTKYYKLNLKRAIYNTDGYSIYFDRPNDSWSQVTVMTTPTGDLRVQTQIHRLFSIPCSIKGYQLSLMVDPFSIVNKRTITMPPTEIIVYIHHEDDTELRISITEEQLSNLDISLDFCNDVVAVDEQDMVMILSVAK